MPTNLPDRKPSGRALALGEATGRRIWLVAILGVPAAAAVLAVLVPGPLLLPAFSMLLLATGFALAIRAWRARARHAWSDDLLHVAAGLVFLGFAASILTDGPTALRAFDDLVADIGGQAPATNPH